MKTGILPPQLKSIEQLFISDASYRSRFSITSPFTFKQFSGYL
jgi:hypothetical protein